MLTMLICVLVFLLLGGVIGGLLEGFRQLLCGKLTGTPAKGLLAPLQEALALFRQEDKLIRRQQFPLAASALAFTLFSGLLFYAGNDIFLSIFSMLTARLFLAALDTSYQGRNERMGLLCEVPLLLVAALGFALTSGRTTVGNLPLVSTLPLLRLPLLLVMLVLALPLLLSDGPLERAACTTAQVGGLSLLLVRLTNWYHATWLMGFVGLFALQSGVWWTVPLALLLVVGGNALAALLQAKRPIATWEQAVKLCWGLTVVLGGLNLLALKLL
jgi:ech hydrogenase subunit B